jgi:CheY-like chemotaxis protein
VKLEHALVADGSDLCRKLCARLLKSLVVRTTTAGDVADAQRVLDDAQPIDLVLVDAELPGGGARSMLEQLDEPRRAAAVPRPAVIVLSREVEAEWQTDPLPAGVTACLRKPVTLKALAQAVWALDGSSKGEGRDAERSDYASPVWAALLDEAGRMAFLCEVRDLSRTGALLLTQVPIDVGERLRLRIGRAAARCELDAVVARIQRPDWGHLPGVGVAFSDREAPGLRELLEG